MISFKQKDWKKPLKDSLIFLAAPALALLFNALGMPFMVNAVGWFVAACLTIVTVGMLMGWGGVLLSPSPMLRVKGILLDADTSDQDMTAALISVCISMTLWPLTGCDFAELIRNSQLVLVLVISALHLTGNHLRSQK